MTILPTPATEISLRWHYLYNYKNDNPTGVAPYVNNVQAGDAAWVNFAASYEVVHGIRVGINGYYFRQLSDDKENGEEVANSRTTDLAMGPGVFWQADRHNIFMANTYFPVVERNTASGFHANIRWIYDF